MEGLPGLDAVECQFSELHEAEVPLVNCRSSVLAKFELTK